MGCWPLPCGVALPKWQARISETTAMKLQQAIPPPQAPRPFDLQPWDLLDAFFESPIFKLARAIFDQQAPAVCGPQC